MLQYNKHGRMARNEAILHEAARLILIKTIQIEKRIIEGGIVQWQG